jgi:hypothetical protein
VSLCEPQIYNARDLVTACGGAVSVVFFAPHRRAAPAATVASYAYSWAFSFVSWLDGLTPYHVCLDCGPAPGPRNVVGLG